MASTVSFSRKPIPQIPDYRPLYRIAKVVMVLNYASRGGKSSLVRLHLFDWCLKKQERMSMLKTFVDVHGAAIDRWGIDPALNFALNIGIQEGLLDFENKGYVLKQKGEELAALVVNNKLLVEEYQFIRSVGKRLTEAKVSSVTDRWATDVAN